MPVSGDELIQAILTPITQALDAKGLTPTYLAKKLKSELNAKNTDTFKGKEVKIALDPKTQKKIGIDVNEIVIYSKPLIAWDIRQKARQDAHRLRGDYPPERKYFETNGNQLKDLINALNGGPVKREEEKEVDQK